MTSLLEIDDLYVELRLRRRTIHPLNGVSLEVRANETLGLVGESGSGKSMLSLAIMRLLPRPFGRVARGGIRLKGEDLLGLPEPSMRGVRGDRISMIFQEPMTALDPLFTVGSQITEAIRAHRRLGADEARRLAVEMLERVEIPSAAQRLGSYPHELSGGMRQRVMIAMALCLRPEILLADEPTTALDVTVQAQILDLIVDLRRELGMGIVLITHDLAVVAEVAERVAVMYAGELMEVAPAARLFSRPRHPYTNGLLRSTPAADNGRRSLYVIPGRPPDLTSVPAGCPFAPRCPQAIERCTVERPVVEIDGHDPSHTFRCWNPVPVGDD